MLLSHLSPQEVDGGGVITATNAAKSVDKDTWRHFKRFCGDHKHFLQGITPSPSAVVVTKTVILSQPMMFS